MLQYILEISLDENFSNAFHFAFMYLIVLLIKDPHFHSQFVCSCCLGLQWSLKLSLWFCIDFCGSDLVPRGDEQFVPRNSSLK